MTSSSAFAALLLVSTSALLLSPAPAAAQCRDGVPSGTFYGTRVYCAAATGCTYRIGSTTPQPAVSAANERCYVDSPYHFSAAQCCPGTFVDSSGTTRPYYSCLPTFNLPSPANRLPTGSVSPLYPYGTGDTLYPRNDDGFIRVSLRGIGSPANNYTFKFQDRSYDHIYLSNNGVLSFDFGLSGYTGGAFPLPNCSSCIPNLARVPVIAPFWADVDTRDANKGGQMQYRLVVDAPTLALYTSELRNSSLGPNFYDPLGVRFFTPNLIVVVTWDAVAAYNALGTAQPGLNTFQAVLFTNGVESFAMFNYGYKALQWDRGSVSPATTFASVGFQGGAGSFYNAPGTLSDRTRDLWFATNTVAPRPGRQVYRVDCATSPCYTDWCGALTPCRNGGTCTNAGAQYTCACAAGFSGADCQTDVDECASTPCANGGTCVDATNGFACSCAPGFAGTLCQTAL